MKTGIELIAEERLRQVSAESWTPEHDDGHDDGSLGKAAVCYIKSARLWCLKKPVHWLSPSGWPWSPNWWKPKDPIRDLVRAGALIAAEIDRLQRKENPHE